MNGDLLGFALASIVQLGAIAWWASGVNSRQRSMHELQVKQAAEISNWSTRHDATVAAWDQKMQTFADRIGEKISRHTDRFDQIEEKHSRMDSSFAAALARMESRIEGMQASMNRLIDESIQRRTQYEHVSSTQSPMKAVDQLRDLLELSALLKKGALT